MTRARLPLLQAIWVVAGKLFDHTNHVNPPGVKGEAICDLLGLLQGKLTVRAVQTEKIGLPHEAIGRRVYKFGVTLGVQFCPIGMIYVQNPLVAKRVV